MTRLDIDPETLNHYATPDPLPNIMMGLIIVVYILILTFFDMYLAIVMLLRAGRSGYVRQFFLLSQPRYHYCILSPVVSESKRVAL